MMKCSDGGGGIMLSSEEDKSWSEFQQDNDSNTQQKLQWDILVHINVLERPSQTPYLNPVGNL